jgi:hypothetical protein
METFSQQVLDFFNKYPAAALIFSLWIIFWKGFALWKAAGKRQLIWFVAILLINTLGVLEIAYIFYLNKWDIDGGTVRAFIEKKTRRSKT